MRENLLAMRKQVKRKRSKENKRKRKEELVFKRGKGKKTNEKGYILVDTGPQMRMEK